jgi:cytosine deaminase
MDERRGLESLSLAQNELAEHRPDLIGQALAAELALMQELGCSSSKQKQIGRRLPDCGVAVTVLPATDLFLMGRDRELHVPRGVAPVHRLLDQGVTCALANNSVLNPFTPFGNCSLIHMANLYANIAQLGRPRDLQACFAMITTLPARLMNVADYGIAVGHPADLVVLDSRDPAWAVAELAAPLFGVKRGRRSFTCAAAALHYP